jgi:hypothetical protein
VHGHLYLPRTLSLERARRQEELSIAECGFKSKRSFFFNPQSEIRNQTGLSPVA